ncbi:hypothetical protein EV702DRAFT_1125393 [Suillus placidus]|uniref:Uncharacterized protein n=1 Tax=Suillus placidus TaxID=48579 RepID=A0A9P6ZPM5_9AGAM|nr:hypothetical protein EV702DRAFT_1125393 [Suillus placidus]
MPCHSPGITILPNQSADYQGLDTAHSYQIPYHPARKMRFSIPAIIVALIASVSVSVRACSNLNVPCGVTADCCGNFFTFVILIGNLPILKSRSHWHIATVSHISVFAFMIPWLIAQYVVRCRVNQGSV